MTDQENKKIILKGKIRRLQILEQQQARLGFEMPPGQILEMENLREEIEIIKKELRDSHNKRRVTIYVKGGTSCSSPKQRY